MMGASTTSQPTAKWANVFSSRVRKIIDTVLLLITFGFAIYNWNVAEDVANTLSTHYIGSFPAFLPQLQALVRQSKNTLLIACDVPGYGLFSAYDDHVAYKAAIASKVSQIHELKMIVLDEAGR